MQVFKNTDITEAFYSDESGKLFEHCLICRDELLTSKQIYFIEKAIRQYQDYEARSVIFEYAMCIECAMTLRSEMSEDSLNKIESYFINHGNLKHRWNHLVEKEQIDINDWLSQCVITGTQKEDLTEYQIVAQCEGDQLVLTAFPYLIGNKAMDQISTLMSNKTLGTIDRFIDQYFSGPPEFKELFKQGKFAII